MNEEIFEIFNRDNKKIGTVPRSEVHEKGLIHRGVNVFLMRNEEIFLHRRAEDKDTSPGQWGMSVGEHLKPGESWEAAARRGLKEELGLSAVSVKQLRGPKFIDIVYEDGKIDKEFDCLFLAESDEEMVLDSNEVAEGKFFPIEEIDRMIEEKTLTFTVFFLKEWKEFKKRL